MNDRRPELEEFVPADDPARARLRATHELLLAAGAPPELPPRLEEAPPEPRTATIVPFRRRRYTAIGAVAIAATVLFGVGYAIGGRDSPKQPVQTVAMTGPSGASATIDLMPQDIAGNWPMTLEVSGLPDATERGHLHALAHGRRQARSPVRHVCGCGRHDEGPAQRALPAEAVRRLGGRTHRHQAAAALDRVVLWR